MSKEVKRIKRVKVYEGSIIDVYKDTMEFQNGNREDWDYVHNKGAAAVLSITKTGNVLMVRQYRSTLERETLEIPAGKLDFPGESGECCAKRELEEETGFYSNQIEWLLNLWPTVAFCDEKIEIFVAKDLKESKQNLDENEFVHVEEYDIETLKKKIFSGEIVDAKTIAAILGYESKYKNV